MDVHMHSRTMCNGMMMIMADRAMMVPVVTMPGIMLLRSEAGG